MSSAGLVSLNYLHKSIFYIILCPLLLLLVTGYVFLSFPHQSLFSSVLLMWFIFWLVMRSSNLFLGQVEYEIVFLFIEISVTILMSFVENSVVSLSRF